MSKSQISRRKLLAAAGLLSAEQGILSGQLAVLLSSLVTGQIAQAYQKTVASKKEFSRNFVQLNMYGAPARYLFDHVLRPNDSDGFLPCEGLYNYISEINMQQPHLCKGKYKDAKVKGFNMPHLWKYNVAKSSGGSRPMSDLMDQMLMIRGCKLASDGHPINNERQVSPLTGEYSITGLVADASLAYFPAINLGKSPANKAFKSPLQAGVVDIPLESADYASFLLEIFHKQSKENSDSPKDVDTAVENAIGFLKQYSLTNQPGSELLYNERKRVEKLIRNGVKNFSEAFTSLSSKYDDLFLRSLQLEPIEGVNEAKIPGVRFPISLAGKVRTPEALATHRIMAESYLMSNDIRDVFAKVKSENLAKSFALAEFVLSEGLSSSIVLSPPIHDRGNMLVNLGVNLAIYGDEQINNIYDETSNTTQLTLKPEAIAKYETKDGFITDCHETGWLPNVIACNLFYKGMSACLLEFIDVMKAKKTSAGKSLFDETVFQYATEFERAPTDSGSGSQHNFLASVTSLYSGVIKKPEIIGNIYVGRKAPFGSVLPMGTIGCAAPNVGLPNKIININNISSTLSEMLRVPRIVPRAASLVEVKEDKLSTLIEPARNVEDDV
jgi:hypothetical protein